MKTNFLLPDVIYIYDVSHISIKDTVFKILSHEQIQIIDSFENIESKKIAIVSELFKRKMIIDLGLKNEDIIRHGKPIISNSNISFSISHSYPYCVFIYSKSEVGIDIEEINDKYKSMLKSIFTKMNNKQQILDYFRLWCRKESLYKTVNNDSFFLELPILKITKSIIWNKKKFFFHEHFIDDNFIIVLCTIKKYISSIEFVKFK